MRVFGWAAALVASCSATALAGEFRSHPATLYETATVFTGFYVGGNAGYAWGKGTLSDFTLDGTNFGGRASTDYDGGFGGGQLGYNRQFGRLVLGIEADFQGTDISKEATYDLLGTDVTERSELFWFATVRGRLGYAFNGIMPYATAGAAFGQNEYGFHAPGVRITDKNVHAGWTVGGGLEYKEDYISIRAEYLYLNLGDETYSYSAGGDTVSVDGKARFHILRSGINYHF